MLTELHIENFAIIDQLDLNFTDRLVTFTGETGAGKSIIIDALGFLLGGRSDSTMIRSGVEQANIEAVFRVSESAKTNVNLILEREHLEEESGWLTLSRELRVNGRNVARVNGRSVNIGLLRELGEQLVDVHGQSEHLSLLRVRQHINLLDRYAANEKNPTIQNNPALPALAEIYTQYRGIYSQLQKVRQELEKLRLSERDAARRVDTLTYQIQEIKNARLTPGEETELKDERHRLSNAEVLSSTAQEALITLDEGTPESPAVTDLFGKVASALTALSRIDPSQASLHEEAEKTFESLTELGRNLRDYLEGIEFNPRRLDQVEERLALIQSLKRKYGDSIESVLEFANRAEDELNSITHSEQRIEELETEKKDLLVKLGKVGQTLSAIRHHAAEQLSNGIETELNDLNMNQAKFKVEFQTEEDENGILLDNGYRTAYYPHGLEQVEFFIAPNPGEGFKPLVKIASGGETSRLMLALKNVLARADEIPTLIFDEIDQGIGGRIGAVVGEKLWTLARQHQVLCITHLPQLAVYGDQHFKVQKQVESGRTTTQVDELDGQERLIELSKMMGEVSEGTLRSAREMLLMAQKKTTHSVLAKNGDDQV
jgi:DNA repair protein RecN (Recombination protein N)